MSELGFEQQAPVSERSSSRIVRAHAAWDQFVDALQGDMSSEELASLSWATVKELAIQFGFNRPLEAAHIELAWQERHLSIEEQKERAVIAVRNEEEARKRREEAAEAAAEEAQRLADERAKKKGYLGGALKRTTSTTSSTRATPKVSTATGATNTTPVKQSTAGSRAIFQSPLQQQAAKREQQASSPVQPVPLIAQPTVEAPPAPQAEAGYYVDPVTFQKSPSPDVKNQQSRIDTGSPKSVSKSANRNSSPRNEVICIQDLHAVFNKYASFGATGNADEGIDSTRFAKLCKECNLIDKVFTVREADVLFQSCKLNSNDRRLPYHQFRMRLVPDLAGKKRVSINDIVRICNYRLCGAEEEAREKQMKVRAAQQRRREIEAEQHAREEFALQEKLAAEAEAAAADAEEEPSQRPIVPPLRRTNSSAGSPKKVVMRF